MKFLKTLIAFVSLILFIAGTNIGILAIWIGGAMLMIKADFGSFFLLGLSFPFVLVIFGMMVKYVFDKLSSQKY